MTSLHAILPSDSFSPPPASVKLQNKNNQFGLTEFKKFRAFCDEIDQRITTSTQKNWNQKYDALEMGLYLKKFTITLGQWESSLDMPRRCWMGLFVLISIVGITCLGIGSKKDSSLTLYAGLAVTLTGVFGFAIAAVRYYHLLDHTKDIQDLKAVIEYSKKHSLSEKKTMQQWYQVYYKSEQPKEIAIDIAQVKTEVVASSPVPTLVKKAPKKEAAKSAPKKAAKKGSGRSAPKKESKVREFDNLAEPARSSVPAAKKGAGKTKSSGKRRIAFEIQSHF